MQVRLVLVTFLLSLTLVCPVAAAPATSAASAVLMDGDTGRILYAQDENTPRPMASTTKLMTALVAVESLGGDLARPVKIQPEWTGIEGTSLYLRPGEILQVASCSTPATTRRWRWPATAPGTWQRSWSG